MGVVNLQCDIMAMNQAKVNRSKGYTERRGSLIILTVTIVLIVLVVIAGVILSFLLEGQISKIVLVSSISLVILIGIVAFIFLECQRRRASKKRDLGAEEWVNITYKQQKNSKNVSSEDGVPMSGQPTWALAQPFRYSQRSTLPAR